MNCCPSLPQQALQASCMPSVEHLTRLTIVALPRLQDDTIERARAGLQRVSKRLGAAYRQAQSWHLLWLVLFALVVFSALYVLSKTRSLLH